MGGLIESKTCVAFFGPNGIGPWQAQEIQVAIDRRVREKDYYDIPVLFPGAERPRRGAVAHLAGGVRLRPSPLDVIVKEWYCQLDDVAFGPEGEIAVKYSINQKYERGGGGGRVVLFDADPATWRRKALVTANRNFTRQEWKTFFPDTPYRRTSRSFCFPHDLLEDVKKQAKEWENEHPAETGAP